MQRASSVDGRASPRKGIVPPRADRNVSRPWLWNTCLVDDDLQITPSVVIPASELQWSFIAAGGPGGQHANTSNTAAELRFDIETSTAFSDAQRVRVTEKLGPSVRIVAREERSQLRNRDLATARLVTMLVEALRVPTVRRRTRPTKGSVQRRLTTKSHTSERKSSRRYRNGDE